MTKHDLKTAALSTLGALALSVTCIGVAIGPAHAATVAPGMAAWQQTVTADLASHRDIVAADVPAGQVAQPEIALQFDAAGRFVGAALARSSGIGSADEEALSVARRTYYPVLPAAWRGAAQTVTLRLNVGAAEDIARPRSRGGQVTVASRAGGGQVASR